MQLAVKGAGGLVAAFDLALVIRLATSDTYRARRGQSETDLVNTIRDRVKHRKTHKRKRKTIKAGRRRLEMDLV